IRLQVDAAALSAITARWPAPRHILLPPERDAAVAAVPRLHKNLRFINKHLLLSLRSVRFSAVSAQLFSSKTQNGPHSRRGRRNAIGPSLRPSLVPPVSR